MASTMTDQHRTQATGRGSQIAALAEFVSETFFGRGAGFRVAIKGIPIEDGQTQGSFRRCSAVTIRYKALALTRILRQNPITISSPTEVVTFSVTVGPAVPAD